MLVAFCLAGASGVTTDLFAASHWRFARLFNEVCRVYMEFVLFIIVDLFEPSYAELDGKENRQFCTEILHL